MFIYNLDGKIHSNVIDPKIFLKSDQYNLFLKILLENKITEKQFVASESSCILFIDKINIFVCHMRDLAGLRFILLNHENMNYELLTNETWEKLEIAAGVAGADLVQVLLPFSNASKVESFNNVLKENYIFEKETSLNSSEENSIVTPIDFTNKIHMQKLAEIEFLTRLKFTSTTYQAKDNFASILHEYMTMADVPGMSGVCIENDPLKGIMIWWSNPEKQNSIGVHLWVSEKCRGHGYGEKLLSAMMDQLYKEGIKSCRCFMSALNLSVIKNFLKYNFKLNYLVLNRIIK